MEKVVLAYSGGLDTSFCAVYLSKVKNLEVHAVLVNLGGFSEDELKSAILYFQRKSEIDVILEK